MCEIKKKYANVILTEIHTVNKKNSILLSTTAAGISPLYQEKKQQNTVKPNSKLPVVFCGSPLCWRVESVFKSSTDRETLMLCCMLLYLTTVTV